MGREKNSFEVYQPAGAMTGYPDERHAFFP
jgi:hypothetical protein